MPTAKVTDRLAATTQPPARGYLEFHDTVEPGLSLRIFSTGGRWWGYRYRAGGRRRRVKLGAYPALSVAKARKRAKGVSAAVARGEDPGAKPSKADTFGALAGLYLERHAAPRKRSAAADERLLRVDVLPYWSNRPPRSLTRRDVRELLDRVVDRGSPVMANRLRALLSSVFAFAVGRELVDYNPVRDVPRPALERRRDRVLSDAELAAVWRALDGEGPEVAAAFRLILLTGQRGGEVRAMRWAEVTGDLWTLPAAATKASRSHVVPLSLPALAILDELRPLTGRSPFVLESPARPGQPMTACLAHVARRVVLRAGVAAFTPHDLRRTAATGLAALGTARVVLGAILNHSDPGVTAVYDRHAYLGEKRQALARWGRHVLAVVEGREVEDGAGVVEIAGRRR